MYDPKELKNKAVLQLRDIVREVIKDINYKERKNLSLSWVAHAKKEELISFILNPSEQEIPVTSKPKSRELEERLRRSSLESEIRKILRNEIQEPNKVDNLVLRIRNALKNNLAA